MGKATAIKQDNFNRLPYQTKTLCKPTPPVQRSKVPQIIRQIIDLDNLGPFPNLIEQHSKNPVIVLTNLALTSNLIQVSGLTKTCSVKRYTEKWFQRMAHYSNLTNTVGILLSDIMRCTSFILLHYDHKKTEKPIHLGKGNWTELARQNTCEYCQHIGNYCTHPPK